MASATSALSARSRLLLASGRDSRRDRKGGVRVDGPTYLFSIRPAMEASADAAVAHAHRVSRMSRGRYRPTLNRSMTAATASIDFCSSNVVSLGMKDAPTALDSIISSLS